LPQSNRGNELENNKKPRTAELDWESVHRKELPVAASELGENAHNESHELPAATTPITTTRSSITRKPLNITAREADTAALIELEGQGVPMPAASEALETSETLSSNESATSDPGVVHGSSFGVHLSQTPNPANQVAKEGTSHAPSDAEANDLRAAANRIQERRRVIYQLQQFHEEDQRLMQEEEEERTQRYWTGNRQLWIFSNMRASK
jgi:hypothetical protein